MPPVLSTTREAPLSCQMKFSRVHCIADHVQITAIGAIVNCYHKDDKIAGQRPSERRRRTQAGSLVAMPLCVGYVTANRAVAGCRLRPLRLGRVLNVALLMFICVVVGTIGVYEANVRRTLVMVQASTRCPPRNTVRAGWRAARCPLKTICETPIDAGHNRRTNELDGKWMPFIRQLPIWGRTPTLPALADEAGAASGVRASGVPPSGAPAPRRGVRTGVTPAPCVHFVRSWILVANSHCLSSAITAPAPGKKPVSKIMGYSG